MSRRASSLRRAISKPEFSIFLIFVAMLIVTALLQKNFFETKSVVRNINAFAPIILVTMGQAVVIISGGIDLSAGTAVSLITCVLQLSSDPGTGFRIAFVSCGLAILFSIPLVFLMPAGKKGLTER